MLLYIFFFYLVLRYTRWHSQAHTHTLEYIQANVTLHHIHHTAPIDMDTESRLPYFLWSRSRACGVGLNVGYCYSRVRAGILGVSIAFRRRPSWPGHKSLSLHAASRPISAILIQVLHDFALSRFQRGGNSRLNVNKISFPLARHSQLLLPRSAVNLPGGSRSVELCWKERRQRWFCHCLVGDWDELHSL